MPGGKPKRARCCCGGGGCPGCCFPLTEDETDFLPIPFEIVAPTCVEVDGASDDFTDDALEPDPKTCGSCGTFSTPLQLAIPTVFWNPDGMGGCDAVEGQGFTMKFQLMCNEPHGGPDDTDEPACCRRLRLMVGTTFETIGTDPTITIPDLGEFITPIAPTSCSCEGGLSAVFSLALTAIKPTENPTPECPYTPGFEVPKCDASLISLVI